MLFSGDTLTISALAEECGKKPQKVTLPNGREVEQITWEGEDLKKINQLLHDIEKPEHVQIDGAAPAWLVAGICHELHPSHCSVNTPQGFIPVGCKSPRGEGYGENIQFKTKQAGDWVLIECQQTDPSIPLDLNKTGDIEPPEVPMGSKVILSGRMPNVVMCSMAQAYQHRTKAVALYQPGVGATVAITHDPSVELGSIVPENLIKKEELKTKIQNQVTINNPSAAIKP